MKKLFVLFPLLLTSHLSFATTSIKAEVNGMVCAFCAKGIEKKLNAMPDTQATFVDLKSRIVVLEMKEGKTVSVEKFTQVIKDAGYSVSKVETLPKTAKAIQAETVNKGEH